MQQEKQTNRYFTINWLVLICASLLMMRIIGYFAFDIDWRCMIFRSHEFHSATSHSDLKFQDLGLLSFSNPNVQALALATHLLFPVVLVLLCREMRRVRSWGLISNWLNWIEFFAVFALTSLHLLLLGSAINDIPLHSISAVFIDIARYCFLVSVSLTFIVIGGQRVFDLRQLTAHKTGDRASLDRSNSLD